MNWSWVGSTIVAVIGIVSPMIYNFFNEKTQTTKEIHKMILSSAEENYKKQTALFDKFSVSLATWRTDINDVTLKNKLIVDFFALYPYLANKNSDDSWSDQGHSLKNTIDMFHDENPDLIEIQRRLDMYMLDVILINEMLYDRFKTQIQNIEFKQPKNKIEKNNWWKVFLKKINFNKKKQGKN